MKLTGREEDVLNHLIKGHSRKEIAKALGISEDTARAYLHRLYIKFGIDEGDKRVKLAVEWYYRKHPEKRI